MIRNVCDYFWPLNDVHQASTYATATMPADLVNGISNVLSQDGRLRSAVNTVSPHLI